MFGCIICDVLVDVFLLLFEKEKVLNEVIEKMGIVILEELEEFFE